MMAPNLCEDESGTQVLKELDDAKEELNRLRINVASTLQVKEIAEKEIEASNARALSYSIYIEKMRKEIEEANEEQLLVELGRIEAKRECREIEAKRGVEFTQFSKKKDIARRRIKDIYEEISRTKELEVKLMTTTSDVNVLQKEMEFIREMERNFKNNHLVKNNNKIRDEELAEVELKAKKTELERIKAVGFQLMDEMDFVRGELMNVAEERERLKKLEKEANSSVQYLDSNLLKSMSKLESASRAEERVNAIVPNFSAALQQLQIDIDAAKKEKELIDGEIDAIQIEIEKENCNSKSTEKRLRATLQELESIKYSEAIAIQKLKRITERTMQARALSSLGRSNITISSFEYEYLVKGAEAAEEVAGKKVAAAQAWIKALEVVEMELLTKSEIIEREIRELRVGKEEELSKPEKASVTKEMPRRSVSLSSIHGEAKRVKMRSSMSPGRRRSITQSPPCTVRRKRMVAHNLVKFLRGRRIR